jgi:serine/threonine-protein kinase
LNLHASVLADAIVPREQRTAVDPELQRRAPIRLVALRPPCATASGCPAWCEGADPPPPPSGVRPTIEPGVLIGERFLLDALVGRGGMGDVYRATNTTNASWVAVKVMRTEHAGDIELLGRFATEARALARVQHPNVVGYVDAGHHEGAPYLVMEYVDGPNLSTIARATPKGRFGIRRTLDLLDMICDGVEAIHEAGVVHGDLKTGNVFLDGAGRAVVGDLGLARPWSSCCRMPLGKTAGTPPYMAPELITGSAPAPAPASDVYALGALAFRMLTGHLPFEAPTRGAVFERHVLEAPPRPSKLRSELPPALDDVILRALAKDPGARFGSARAFANAMRNAVIARPRRAWSEWWPWSRA